MSLGTHIRSVECIDILLQKYSEHNTMEQRAFLDEAVYLNPQDQVLFQDPFVGFLESSKEVVFYAMNDLLQNSRKILKTYVQRKLQGEWLFFFFYLLKNVSKNQSCSHLLDWLHWRKENMPEVNCKVVHNRSLTWKGTNNQ